MAGSRLIAGVLGGMGPAATVDFMARVLALTPATSDQDHVHMIVDQDPSVPGRQAAILDGGEDPGEAMAHMAARLEKAGADFLVMPCNTAHIFERSVIDAVGIPLLSIVDATVTACDGFPTVGLLATEGCLAGRQYQRTFEAAGIEVVLQQPEELAALMTLTFRIKAGDRSDALIEEMRGLAAKLADRGAQAVVAACTEIPLVLDASMLPVPLISSVDELARLTITAARGSESPCERGIAHA